MFVFVITDVSCPFLASLCSDMTVLSQLALSFPEANFGLSPTKLPWIYLFAFL